MAYWSSGSLVNLLSLALFCRIFDDQVSRTLPFWYSSLDDISLDLLSCTAHMFDYGYATRTVVLCINIVIATVSQLYNRVYLNKQSVEIFGILE